MTTNVVMDGAGHTCMPRAVGLYDPSCETESCGVGAIANLDATPSRRYVIPHILSRTDLKSFAG